MSLLWWVLKAFISFWLTERKGNQSEKVSIKWKPSKSSLFKKLKKERTLFKQMLMSIIKLLIFNHCLGIRRDIAI